MPLRVALLIVVIGGWWLLPVTRYAGLPGGVPAWQVTGIALPSDMLLTKAWIPPLVGFVGAALCDRRTLRTWRPALIDLPMAGWCLWPLVEGLGGAANPAPWIASIYVCGAWGLPWLIGRLWISGSKPGLALVNALALSGIANLPVALIEGVRPAMLYTLVYGYQPFQLDGVSRYFGYRPMGFLEDGNLYGLWTALAAFAAVWLWRNQQGPRDARWLWLAIMDVGIALASQSAGAILLLVIGLGLLAMWRSPLFLPGLSAIAALLLLIGIVHLSGIIPLQSIAHSPPGMRILGAMRAIGRGSFLWRISQDTKTLASIAAHPLLGAGQWDWWRSFGTRPWGQAVLLIGQYGVVGLLLAWGALLSAGASALVRLRRSGESALGDAALPLAIIVILALADACLNAFFFFPAIIAAGAVATVPRPDRVRSGEASGDPPLAA